jgi:hypothetical protein
MRTDQSGQSSSSGLATDQSSSSQTRSSTDYQSTPGTDTSSVRTQGFRGESGLGAMSGGMGNQFVQIKQEIARRCGELTQRELSNHQGAAFDKAYVGQQIIQHIDMLAALQTFEQHASGNLQQTIRQGVDATERHLTQARQIMQQLDQGSASSDRGTGSRNPGASSGTSTSGSDSSRTDSGRSSNTRGSSDRSTNRSSDTDTQRSSPGTSGTSGAGTSSSGAGSSSTSGSGTRNP